MADDLATALAAALRRAGVEISTLSVEDFTFGGDVGWHHGFAYADEGRRFWFVAVRGPKRIEAHERRFFVADPDGALTQRLGHVPEVVVPSGEIRVLGLDEE